MSAEFALTCDIVVTPSFFGGPAPFLRDQRGLNVTIWKRRGAARLVFHIGC
jgi:hypothetical protein